MVYFLSITGALAGNDNRLQSVVETLRGTASAVVGKTKLTNTAAIVAFYERGGMTLAWSRPGAMEELRRAIRNAEEDGLRPADYHLAALDAALESNDPLTSDLIATDAIIRLIAHLRYGKVNPARLNQTWNHPARHDATTLAELLDELRGSPSLEAAIDQQRPQHFVYAGLRQALTDLRGSSAAGGWPKVELPGRIKPGADHPGVTSIRERLRVSGHWSGNDQERASTRYDAALVTAVKTFQSQHRLLDHGIIGKATVDAMNISAAARVEQIRVNLERARWVLGGLGQTFLLVNLPAYKAYLIRDGSVAWETRVQIGKAARKTPTLRSDINLISFNPTWTVPPTIMSEDIGPALKGDRNYLHKRGLIAVERSSGRAVNAADIDWATASLADYRFTQPAGRDNALGVVKFIMDNPYAIFLHDTPRRDLFASEQRSFGSGCIRVEHPVELASLLLDPAKWPRARIDQIIGSGETRTLNVYPSMPVAIVYWTASIGASGTLRFSQDVYDYDREVSKALDASLNQAVWWPQSAR